MEILTRWFSAIMAVLLGLPLLLSSVVQSATKLGYDERPVEAIEANFLKGTEDFIENNDAEYWSVGYSKEVLTPDDIDSHRYFLGGYLKFPAQEVTGVIDELCVRAVVLDDNSGRGAVAFAWVDGIGLMNADVKAVREQLTDITGDGMLISIDVGSTHTHSGIDTQGLWGNIPNSGRDEKYLTSLIEKTASAIRNAYKTKTDGTLYYASEEYPEMFADTRAPYSIDENIHLFKFVPNAADINEIYIANFGAHPVNVGWSNTELSGDFPYYVEKAINSSVNADFIFIQGAIGGGIHCNTEANNGIDTTLSEFEQMKQYSNKVANILIELSNNAKPITPVLNIRHAHVDFEINNFIFNLAERAGLCNATAFKENGKVFMTSEIGYIEIGDDIKILEVPGEVMPEIVYGGFYSAEQSYNKTEYPYASLNTLFRETDKILVFGLCNDAVGYIVPDNDYSASNEEGHYEETVSTGSSAASSLSKAFAELISTCQNAE